jgi:PEP-CTERM motif-containing protein
MTLTGDTTIPSVPEPGTLALVAGGALVLIARRRLTKR